MTITHDELSSYEEIRRLALRYALAIDRRDLDLLVSLYVEDVWVGQAGTGREVLRKDFGDGLKKIGVSMLFVGNHLIDLDPDDHDKATGIVYCRARIQATPDSPDMVEHAIQYSDWYERARRHLVLHPPQARAVLGRRAGRAGARAGRRQLAGEPDGRRHRPLPPRDLAAVLGLIPSEVAFSRQ